MTIPKINSAHGSDTRNIINRAIDLINAQGKSIQDLVAEGQLTPTQYAELVSIVNGNVKKGDITTADIDKNNFSVDQTMITDELRRQITGNTPINAVPANNSIGTVKIIDDSITRNKRTVGGEFASVINNGSPLNINTKDKVIEVEAGTYIYTSQQRYQILESVSAPFYAGRSNIVIYETKTNVLRVTSAESIHAIPEDAVVLMYLQFTNSSHTELLSVVCNLEYTVNGKNRVIIDSVHTEEIVDGSITTSKVAEKAITPKEINFFVPDSKNKATGIYQNWGLIEVEGSWVIQGVTPEWNGRIQVVDVNPNTTYTVSNHDKSISNRFGIAISDNPPTFDEDNYFYPDRIIKTDDISNTITLTTDANTRYLYVYPSSLGEEPRIQVEEGSIETNYESYYILPKDMVFPEIEDEFIRRETTASVIETVAGYPPRPDVLSVIWIGVNEPTEAEPFDEWRQTEGFTHFNDFEQYELDSAPSDWDIEWNNPETFKVTHSQDLDEKRLEIKNATNSFFFASWENINIDDFREDSEIYIKGQLSRVPEGAALQSVHRGGGVIGSETGYVIGARYWSDNNFSISKIVDGSSTILHSRNFEIDFTLPYHQVSRIDGDRLRVKVWQEGQNEPKKWSIDMVDSNPLPQTGKIGVYCYMHLNRNFLYSFGVGTGGMRAPRRQVL